MALQFAIGPNFNVRTLASWFILCRRLSSVIEQSCRLRLFVDFNQLDSALRNDEIDLIYADALTMAFLVREKDYLPVARANNSSNEVLVAVNTESAVRSVTDFRAPLIVAATWGSEVQMFGRSLVESALIRAEDVSVLPKSSAVAVAMALIKEEADAGFFLRDDFEGLTGLVRSKLRPVVSTQINSLGRSFLVRPRLAHLKEVLLEEFESMQADPDRRRLLIDLELTDVSRMSFDEAEFMIDLMEKLQA